MARTSVTIKDVAREARVSVATVSRALNGHENVAESVRQQVLATADRLRYQPHAAAQQPPGALLAQLVLRHMPGCLEHRHAQRLGQHMDIHAAFGQACAGRRRGGQRLHGL